MLDSGEMLKEEIRSLSLLGINGFTMDMNS